MKLIRVNPRAAAGLGKLGGKAALAQMQLAAESSQVSQELAEAIFRIQPDASVFALDKVSRCFHSNFDKPRVDAVEMLAKVGNPEAIAALKFALRDDSAAVRQAARKGLIALKAMPTTATAPAGP